MCVFGFGDCRGDTVLYSQGYRCSKSAEIVGVCQHIWLMWFQGLDSTLPHAKQALALPTARPLQLQAFAFRKTCRTSHRKITQRETFCSNSPSWASAVGGWGWVWCLHVCAHVWRSEGMLEMSSIVATLLFEAMTC